MRFAQLVRSLYARPLVRELLVLAVLLSLFLMIRLAQATLPYELPSSATDMEAVSELFQKDIHEFGGTAAYKRLSKAIVGLNVDEQHGYAHSFGHALYTVEGEKGIVACDGNFGLGCFHQFLGDAILDLGPTSVQRLYDACTTVIGTQDACQHGLGHGVLSGFGYGPEDLRGALDLCDEVTKVHNYSGCKGGVFMEYNIRTIAGAEGILGARIPENGDLYAPCDTLGEADGKVCMFWLPQWWYFSVIGSSGGADVYQRMGVLCAKSPYPQTCYEGIGYITPVATGFSVGSVRSTCDRIESEGAVYCRSMAALIFHITPHTRGTEAAICDGLLGNEHSVCMQYAAHDGNFSFTVPGGLSDAP